MGVEEQHAINQSDADWGASRPERAGPHEEPLPHKSRFRHYATGIKRLDAGSASEVSTPFISTWRNNSLSLDYNYLPSIQIWGDSTFHYSYFSEVSVYLFL